MLFAINTARLFVLPLKQFGMVAGRLAVRSTDASAPPLPRMTAAMCALMAVAGTLVVLAGHASLAPESVITSLVWLVAAQLLVEPFTSFLSAVRKVAQRPSATLGSLAVTIGAVLATLAVLLLGGWLSAVTTWITWICGRVVFAILVVRGVPSTLLAPHGSAPPPPNAAG